MVCQFLTAPIVNGFIEAYKAKLAGKAIEAEI
jgi:hypothetical protein